MSQAPESAVDREVRIVCVFFALSSFPLAAWMLARPDAFFVSLGLGGSPFVASLYAGAIAGEGVMFALGARDPARYRVFFEYMAIYKALAALAATRVAFGGEVPALAAAGVVVGWSVAGLISAWLVARGRLGR